MEAVAHQDLRQRTFLENVLSQKCKLDMPGTEPRISSMEGIVATLRLDKSWVPDLHASVGKNFIRGRCAGFCPTGNSIKAFLEQLGGFQSFLPKHGE